MNERGIKAYDALLLEDAISGEMLGIQKYGKSADAHAEIAADGSLLFHVHADGDEPKTQVH